MGAASSDDEFNLEIEEEEEGQTPPPASTFNARTLASAPTDFAGLIGSQHAPVCRS
jgi:hypothetical protein